jgi:hypothetical protein
MKQTRKVAIAASAFVCAAMFSFSWSEQSGVSLSVDNAQAQGSGAFLPSAGETPGVGYGRRRGHTRLVVRPVVRPYYYSGDTSGLPWDAVRIYYAGGPWCPTTPLAGLGYYGCYSGWDDYAKRFGIGCTPGTPIKGGDGIMYACQ